MNNIISRDAVKKALHRYENKLLLIYGIQMSKKVGDSKWQGRKKGL